MKVCQKVNPYRIVWSAEDHDYQLRDLSKSDSDKAVTPQSWAEWLVTCGSFAFEGQEGYLNLLKESRGNSKESGNNGYWYAYRRQGQRTIKKYAGQSSQITLSRLEELAALLAPSASEDIVVPPSPIQVEGVPQPVPVVHEKSPLLLPKLSLPRLHSDNIKRERLLVRLDGVLQHRLTVVTAPAGFGKTTLARQWIAEHVNEPAFPPVGWLSLDQTDNEPGRFWRYFIAACQTVEPSMGQLALQMLETQAQPPFETTSWERLLVTLLNDLVRLPNGLIMVLEDFHAITHPHIYQNLEFLIDHLPTNFHLLILTRTTPHLPMTRWWVLNEVGELTSADLRFNQAEAGAFSGAKC